MQLSTFRASRAFITITVSTAIFTDVFIYELVVPVLPYALSTRAHVSPQSVQRWVAVLLTVYGAATLVASPFCGYIADRTPSRRLPYLAGLVALAASTALLFVGSSIAVLVVARVLQGISAAVVGVVGLALLADSSGPEAIGQSMGYVGLSMSLAILTAPPLGGVVYATAGYDAVFAMGFGLIGLDCVLRLLILEKSITTSSLPVDEAVVTRSMRLDQSAQGDDHVEIELSDIPSADDKRECKADTQPRPQSGDTILAQEPNTGTKSSLERLPPVLYLLTSRRLLTALWAITVQASLLTALDSILPLHVRNTFHWNSIGAGLVFLPIVVVTFAAPIIGHYSDKLGPRWFAVLGFMVCCPPLILLRLVHANSIGQKVLLCALLAMFAGGSTLVVTPMMAEITYAVDAKTKRKPPGFFGKNGAFAQAYGLFNMAWAAGGMIGPLLGGLITERAGWNAATLVLGIASIVTAVPTAIWTGGTSKEQTAQGHESGDTSDATGARNA